MSVPVSGPCRRGSDGCEIKGPHELCGTVVPVSGLQEAVEKARQIAFEIIPPPGHDPDCPIFDGEGSSRPRVCGDRRYCHAQIDYDQSIAEGSMRIADALVAAQLSALESVAKGCVMCKEGHELRAPGDGKSRWWHVNPEPVHWQEGWDYCRRPEVQDAILRLRSGEEPGGEQK